VVAVVQTYSAEGIFSRLSVVCRDVHDLIDQVNYCALVPCTFFKKSRAHSERTCERASTHHSHSVSTTHTATPQI
jgi:hypothetical protein